ncbi:MAG: ParB/RepB/Spo0J family partition protein [Gammaproteobacteria bacterium]|nr:ParB/RepB/Spo0J family partition protein [Gammaproteobacteria bacterium]
MSKKKRFGVSQAISRGLSETIHVVENHPGIYRHIVLPLSRIELDPENPRKLAITLEDVRHGINPSDELFTQKMSELEKLKELAVTIQQSGIINPIVVYKRADHYRVVAGERRCLASILCGQQEIDARVFNEKPKGFELKLIQWVENTAREDLNLSERIENIRDILNEYARQNMNAEISPTLLKTITGLSLPQASYYISVMNAHEELQSVIRKGMITSLDKAAVIASVTSDTLRDEMLKACVEGCTLKELRHILSKGKKAVKLESKINVLKKQRGRSASKVNLGATSKPRVVETIVHSVLNQQAYLQYAEQFANIDWKHYDHASKSFRKLVEIIEHETEE